MVQAWRGGGASAARYHKAGHDDVPRRGPRSVLASPGAVAALDVALDMARAFGGRMPLADLAAPAIKAAREGWAQSAMQAKAAPADFADLAQQPNFAAHFLVDGKLPDAGQMRRAERLADTLDQLAHAGLQDFFRGDVAREMAGDLERIKSPLLREDLARTEARLRKPLSMRLGPWTCFHAGPPANGLTALLAAALHGKLGARAYDDFASLHAQIESAKAARLVADPLGIDPRERMQDPARALMPDALERACSDIAKDRARDVRFPLHETNNECLAAIDVNGLAVTCLTTLHSAFGSGCILPRTGMLMGNRGHAFSLDPASPHALAPGLRVPHAPSPALAVSDTGQVLAFGGGEPETALQIFTRIASGQETGRALDMARFALTQDDKVIGLRIEERVDPSTLRALEKAGHRVFAEAPYAATVGRAGVLMRRRDGSVEAAADPRGEGDVQGL